MNRGHRSGSRGRAGGEPMRIDQAIEKVAAGLDAAPLGALDELERALQAWWSSVWTHRRAGSVAGADTVDEFTEVDPTAVSIRSFVRGELVIAARDTRVANELRYRRDELVRCLASVAVEPPIERVRVRLDRGG